MAIQMALSWNGVKLSGVGPSRTAEAIWIVLEATSDEEAIEYARANAPATVYDNIPRVDVVLGDRLTEDTWLVTVKYSMKQQDQQKEPRETTDPVTEASYEIEFDTTGGTEHISHSLATVAAYSASGDTIDFKKAINDDGETVQGVDILARAFSWSETHFIQRDNITQEYIETLEDMSGSVNNDTFRNRAAGEVLFIGASGKAKDKQTYALTFKFERRANQTGQTVGDITGIDSEGHHYVWNRYAHSEVSDGGTPEKKRMVKKVVQVNVEQVYYYKDFADLGIGTEGLQP